MKDMAIQKAKDWLSNPFYDEESKQEISRLLEKGETDQLIDRFYKDLSFGTGGIRGILGYGSNRMNKYSIMRATNALALEVKKLKLSAPKVAISYDSRRFSYEFARLTASVLAGHGIHAYIYKRLNPVCLLSWSVRYHQAQAGVMITASHNPPEYNGYKVYWGDGCQVTAPYDQNIINFYYQEQDLSKVPVLDFDEGIKQELIHWVGDDVENKYLDMVLTQAINPDVCKNHGTKLKFVYTPIHGSGLIPCTRAFNDLGLTNYQVVEAQSAPNGDFPTVESPNPENPSALKMAVDLMTNNSASLAFGSDPDADRIGVAVNHQGEVHYLSGNQLGSLMLYYICQNLSEQQRMPANPYCLKTIVTTELQSKIAAHYGVAIENTLTGFKWLCGRMRDIENNQPKRNFVFATEESFGYLNHANVRDKDGIAPLALLAEMALCYQLKNMTLVDALDELYQKFGLHYESLLNLNYYGAQGAQKIEQIMIRFRESNFKELCGEKISSVEDYQTQILTSLKDGKTSSINLPKSNVLCYNFASGDRLCLRPSGTEPKIKFYLLLQERGENLAENKLKAKAKSDRFINYIKDFCDKV